MSAKAEPDQGVRVDRVREDAYLKGLAAGRSERAAEVEALKADLETARGQVEDLRGDLEQSQALVGRVVEERDTVRAEYDDATQALAAELADERTLTGRLQAENEALRLERDRAMETRENANAVSVRVEAENEALKARAVTDAEWNSVMSMRTAHAILGGEPGVPMDVLGLAHAVTAARRERDEARAENEALKAILDGCDDAAIDRAGFALWEANHGVVPVNRYRKMALIALRAAGECQGASDEQGPST